MVGKNLYFIQDSKILEMPPFTEVSKYTCTLNFDDKHFIRVSGQRFKTKWFVTSKVQTRMMPLIVQRIGLNGLKNVPIAIPKLSTGREGHGCTRTVYKGKPAILVAGGTSFADGNDDTYFGTAGLVFYIRIYLIVIL